MKKNKYKNYKTYSTDSTISSQFNSYGKTHDDTTNYEQILKKNQNENSFFKKAAFKSSTIAIDNVPTCMEYPNPFDTSGSTSPYDKPNPRKLNKDYNNLVKDFEFVKPYSKSNGLYPSDTLCIMCRVNQPLNVLFPCLHKCVCSSCIKMHNITSMSHAATVSGAWR
jgi:hypothetical protein